jgi:hypothetical protein
MTEKDTRSDGHENLNVKMAIKGLLALAACDCIEWCCDHDVLLVARPERTPASRAVRFKSNSSAVVGISFRNRRASFAPRDKHLILLQKIYGDC